jgi:hypothetical protein
MALLLFMTLAAWSMGSAVGSSPDEDYVLTSIWCGTEGNPPHCRKDPDRDHAMILPIMAAEPQLCYMPGNGVESAACQRAIFDQEISTGFLNRGLYPSQYFDLLRNFVSNDIELSVVKMRLFNSFLTAVLVVSAVSFFWRRNSDLLLAWLAVIAPVTSYFIASVNTSSWNLTGLTVFVIAFLSGLRNRADRKLSITAGVVALFALWLTNSSRYEGKYIVFLLAATMLVSELTLKRVRRFTKTVLICLTLTSVMLLAYNYFAGVYGRIDIFNDTRVITEGITTTADDLLIKNLINLPRFIMGFFGGWGLGWFELSLSHTVWLFALQAFVLTMGFALRNSHNFYRFISIFLFTIMCSAILYANQQTFTEIGDTIQPRYFLPFFLGIVIIAAANKTERYPNSLVITVAILASISNSIALRDTIRRYTTGKDIFISKSLNNPIEWWWQFGPQPETVWLTGTLAFAALWAILIYDRNKEELNAPNSPTPELAS